MLCPCDLKKQYEECCGRYHTGLPPENALALMRSRYSAYALHLVAYIIKTTHPAHIDYDKDQKKWAKDLLIFCQTTEFKGLKIVSFADGEIEATVTFEAYLQQGKEALTLKEESLFEKVEGIWLYKAGVHETL